MVSAISQGSFFPDAVVSSALTCLPWDGGKGGIVVFNVAGSLQLNANIDVVGKGFRGGADITAGQLVTNCFTNGYYYPITSGNIAAIKGESISTISNNIIRGKGALLLQVAVALIITVVAAAAVMLARAVLVVFS
ncbi:MAG: hypothetical protein WDO71_26700 [Bacteroidota bacterium]